MPAPDAFLHSQGWAQQVNFFAEGQHLPLLQQVAALRAAGKHIFPAQQDIFAAFAHTAWDAVRVLIMGQDPYHGAGQAHGLAFSVSEGCKMPPSLRNILAEVARTEGAAPNASPCLTRWAEQGVLLLNAVLTVEEGKAHSHAGLGWQTCTTAVVKALAARPRPLAVLLWGNAAQDYLPYFSTAGAQHLVLCAAHPSPLSAYRGFHGCGHFAAVNTWLVEQGDTAIAW